MTAPLRIFIIAGELSGDRLGAGLMRGLRAEVPGSVQFLGVGGAAMAEEGLESLFPIEEIAVMGLTEVVPRLTMIFRRIRQTADAALRARPDALITIDSPDFCHRVSASVRAGAPEMPLIHYVAPSVWAWRPGRARRLATRIDHLLAVLPFEPPYFEREGLTCDFVGHSVVERTSGLPFDGGEFRAQMGIDPAVPLIAVLPGSRAGEIGRLAGVFGETIGALATRKPGLRVVVPAAETVAGRVARAVEAWPVPVQVLDPAGMSLGKSERRKFLAIAAADIALAASGTVSLEIAAMETPAIAAYRTSWLTAAIARRLIRVETGNLLNLILGEKIVPEFFQERARPEPMAAALANLFDDPAARARQQDAARRCLALLGRGGEPPSIRAARSALRAIARKSGGRA